MSHEDYKPYEPTGHYTYHTTPKGKKKRTGLLIVLVCLALITGIVSWAVNFMNLQVDVGDHNLTLTLGNAEEEDPGLIDAQPDDQPARDDTAEKVRPAGDTIQIAQTPQSVEQYPVQDGSALSLQQIYEKVFPSVASISCVYSGGSGSGTGIVLSEEGYIITNYHVIEQAAQIYVLLGQDDQYEATLIGCDEATDLAVLKVDAEGLQPAEFGDSDMLRVGDAVVAIGDPLGAQLRGTMTDGIVSAINRDLNLSGRQMTLIQTNAALNTGNSGGPLINCYGQVVGINTMKMSNYSSNNTTVEGLGFAIPIVQAKPILDELIERGYVSGRPAVGIQGQSVDLRVQLFYHLPAGVIVTEILEDSNAYETGLQINDVIVEFDGISIGSLDDLVMAKSDYEAGDVVKLTIFRKGRYYSAEIELMDQVKPDIY